MTFYSLPNSFMVFFSLSLSLALSEWCLNHLFCNVMFITSTKRIDDGDLLYKYYTPNPE